METLTQHFFSQGVSLSGFGPSVFLLVLVFFPFVSNGTPHRQLSREKGLLRDGPILQMQGMRELVCKLYWLSCL